MHRVRDRVSSSSEAMKLELILFRRTEYLLDAFKNVAHGDRHVADFLRAIYHDPTTAGATL